MLQSMGSQRVEHNLLTEQQQQFSLKFIHIYKISYIENTMDFIIFYIYNTVLTVLLLDSKLVCYSDNRKLTQLIKEMKKNS